MRRYFFNLKNFIFATKEIMKKAKSSEEVHQRTTRASSKIFKTIQGEIINFARFQAEPKKTNSSKNESKSTKAKSLEVLGNLTESVDKNIMAKSQNMPQSKPYAKETNKPKQADTITKRSPKTLNTLCEPKIDQKTKQSPKSKKKSYNIIKTGPTNECKLKTSPLKRDHIKIEPDTPSDKSPGPSPSKIKKFVPPNWQQIFENLKEMRKNWDAPVDTMGCHKCTDDNASDKDKRYQNLLALMLSSQTKDQVTHAAMQRLINHGCSVNKICLTSGEDVGKLIYPVSFWKNKANYIKKTSEILKNQYDGDIPSTLEELIKLPGVGPKMAHLCMQIAWNEVSGIGVDTHVHRISNRLGWVKTKTPEQTRVALEAWLPKQHWAEINVLLVGLGQTICKPDKPKCGECLNRNICPSALKF